MKRIKKRRQIDIDLDDPEAVADAINVLRWYVKAGLTYCEEAKDHLRRHQNSRIPFAGVMRMDGDPVPPETARALGLHVLSDGRVDVVLPDSFLHP